MTDPNLQHDLGRFWDDLTRDGPAPSNAVDLELASLIRQLHARRDDVPPPDAAFFTKLREDLMNQSNVAGSFPLRSIPLAPPVRNGLVTPRFRRDGSPRPAPAPLARGANAARLIALALLLMSFGICYALFRPDGTGPGQFASLPAAVAPVSTPSPAIPTEGTLLDVTVPANDVPATSGLAGGLTYVTIAPGNASTWAGNCCPGLRANYVLEGTLTIRPAGPMRIVRAGGVPETVPAGTDVTLGAGDAMIIRNEVPFDSANHESTPLLMLLIDLTTQQNDVPAGWVLPAFSGAIGFTAPAGPLVLRLERTQLDPGADQPSRPGASALMVLALQDDAAGTPAAAALESQGGSPVLNPPFLGTDREAVVYVLTFNAAGESTGSPTAGSPTAATPVP